MNRWHRMACALGLAIVLPLGGGRADDKKSDPPQPDSKRIGLPQMAKAPLIPSAVQDELKLTDWKKDEVGKLAKEYEQKVRAKTSDWLDANTKALKARDFDALTQLKVQEPFLLITVEKLRDYYDVRVMNHLSEKQKKTYAAAMEARPQSRDDLMAEREFRQLDKNADGLLDDDEMPFSLQDEIAEWDTNKDGVIDLYEFKRYYKARIAFLRANGKADPSKAPLDPKELRIPVVQDRLNLTAEQKGKMEKLEKEFMEQSLKLLTEEQKKKLKDLTDDDLLRFSGNGDSKPKD